MMAPPNPHARARVTSSVPRMSGMSRSVKRNAGLAEGSASRRVAGSSKQTGRDAAPGEVPLEQDRHKPVVVDDEGDVGSGGAGFPASRIGSRITFVRHRITSFSAQVHDTFGSAGVNAKRVPRIARNDVGVRNRLLNHEKLSERGEIAICIRVWSNRRGARRAGAAGSGTRGDAETDESKTREAAFPRLQGARELEQEPRRELAAERKGVHVPLLPVVEADEKRGYPDGYQGGKTRADRGRESEMLVIREIRRLPILTAIV